MSESKENKVLATTRIYVDDKALMDQICARLEASSGLEATAPRVLKMALQQFNTAMTRPAQELSSQELAHAIALLCQMYHRDSAKVRRIAADLQEELAHLEDIDYAQKETTEKKPGGSAKKRAG